MTYMRAWMTLKFDQVRLLVTVAIDRVIMENTVLPLFLGCFFIRTIILAGKDDMQESSEEFEFLLDPTTDCGVRCP